MRVDRLILHTRSCCFLSHVVSCADKDFRYRLVFGLLFLTLRAREKKKKKDVLCGKTTHPLNFMCRNGFYTDCAM